MISLSKNKPVYQFVTYKVLIIIAVTFSACSTIKPLPDKTVNHSYTNIEFTPDYQSSEISPDFKLSVTPIDAATLNQTTLLAANSAGDYEQEVVREYFRYDSSSLSSSEIRYTENLIEVSNTIMSDMNSNQLSQELAYSLLERAWNGVSAGMDGSEISTLTSLRYTADFNPYHLNNNYLSVFKLNFSNESNEVNIVHHDRFQIASGNEILYPFKMDYFEDRLDEEGSKLENAYRFNLPSTMNVAPRQSVDKYISVPAISSNANNLTLQYFKSDNGVVEYEFGINQVREEYETTLTNYRIIPRMAKQVRGAANFFYAVQLENNNTFPLQSDNFYLPLDTAGQTVKICQIQIGRQQRVDSFYNCLDVNLSDFENQLIRVYFNE